MNGRAMPPLFSTVYDLNVFESFSCIIHHIHVLWELVLIGEPLVVLAPSPELCSRLVQALVRYLYCILFSVNDIFFQKISIRIMSI